MSAEGATVPRAEATSYYGRPVLKAPVWSAEVPFYFAAGGLAGASAGLAFAAGLAGHEALARRAWLNAFAGIAVSPPLLIADLGRPERFLNMFRLFKVTSPMSVGSWVLGGSGLATTIAAADAWTGLVPVWLARPARPAAAVLGLPLVTYTAVLVANTAVPVWHEARRALPFVFAASAGMSAGGAAVLTTPVAQAAPARRLAVGGAVVSAAAMEVMGRRLGPLGTPYRTGAAGTLKRAATALALTGGALIAGLGHRRGAAATGGALLVGAAVCERWSVYRAGFQSAADPAATVGPQRARIASGERRGAIRRKK